MLASADESGVPGVSHAPAGPEKRHSGVVSASSCDDIGPGSRDGGIHLGDLRIGMLNRMQTMNLSPR